MKCNCFLAGSSLPRSPHAGGVPEAVSASAGGGRGGGGGAAVATAAGG